MIENAVSLKSALAQICGPDSHIKERRSVSGGDINMSFMLTLSGGERFFLKENSADRLSMFSSESAGLKALGSVGEGAPPVPDPLAWGVDKEHSFLLMEVVERGRLKSGEVFGFSLAEMHRRGRSDFCGFSEDNYIGLTVQKNSIMKSWIDFFAEFRLGFQWELARRGGFGDASSEKLMESVLRRLPELLPEPEEGRPSLLHGDLWGGNWIAGSDGRGWLIDPAAYYGHREADIAMSELFGGFPAGFHSGYMNTWPLESGYPERRDLYNLYHLLNHLNMFGFSYRGAVMSTIKKYS